MTKDQRIVFVDYIRVTACFLVMLVHASENFYAADTSGLAGNMSMLANEANRFWVAFYDGGLGRISVPLFMVVSAFLLVPLRPGTTMRGFYRRRFTLDEFYCFHWAIRQAIAETVAVVVAHKLCLAVYKLYRTLVAGLYAGCAAVALFFVYLDYSSYHAKPSVLIVCDNNIIQAVLICC